jgi:hypothetical protein
VALAGLPAAWRAGRRMSAGVLGAGLLLSAPITAGLAGELAWLAWVVHLATGGLFCFAVGLLSRQLAVSGGPADLVGVAWGAAASRGVIALYFLGFVFGQAAIALAGGQLVAYGIGRGGARGSELAVALGIIAVAVVVAIAVRTVPGRVRSWRLGLTLVAGLAVCADPVLLRGSELLPALDGLYFWPAVFLLLFAGVGWEQSAKLAPGMRNTRELGVAVACAVGLTAAGYLLVGLTASTSSSAPWQSGFSTGLALCAAVLLASYCLTNILAAAGFLGTFTRAGLTARVVAVGGIVAGILLAAYALGARSWQLLAGPAIATWLIYTLTLGSGLRTRSPLLRLALLVPLIVLGLTAAVVLLKLRR